MANNSASILRSLFLSLCALVLIIVSYFVETGQQPALLVVDHPKVHAFFPYRTINSTSKANKSLVTGPFQISSTSLAADIVHNGTDVPPQPTCRPLQRVVYIKTHKTGSTTVASIFERYAYLHSLDVAVPPLKRNHILSNSGLFQMSMVIKIAKRKRKDFDMIFNHVRYNRKQMDKAVPHAKYISIIRNPVFQFESFFGYFELARRLHINTTNPFETFVSNIKNFTAGKMYMAQRARNGQLYDFGFDHKYDENLNKIEEKIEELGREIDLIMINDYFDESLILLRKLMCWNYTDILYISNGVRSKSHRYPITEETEQKILSWNAGDVMLYDYFNKTFWKKVQEYGNMFSQDLAHFRALRGNFEDDCIKRNATNTGDKREDKFVLKRKSAKFCNDLLRGDVPYTRLLKKTMIARYN